MLAFPILGWRWFYLLHMIVLSSQGNIALVALFASAPRIDHEGCCVRRSHLHDLQGWPILLRAIPQSGRLGQSVTLLWFSCTPSRPNKLVAQFFQAFLLDSSDCLLGMHGYCSGVPRDCADTLNSTFPRGVSFLACGDFVHCLFEFILGWGSRITRSAPLFALLGQ